MLRTAWVAILVMGLGSAAWGQDAERLAPKVPAPGGPAQFQAPGPATKPGGNAVVVDDLRGMVFVDSQWALKESSEVKGIDVSGAKLLDNPKFVAQVSPFLGKPLTMDGLNEICRLVVLYCRGEDRPVVDAIVPEQDVTRGTVQILLLEGRVGKVVSEGNRFFPSRLFVDAIRSKPGDEIVQSSLMDDVDWLNRDPFHHTDLLLQSGAEVGQTDVVLQSEDHFPVRVYAGYENTGPISTGGDRWLTGFNTGNTLGLDDQLNYQFTANSDIQRFIAHSASYVLPLPWRNILTIFGNWSSTRVMTDPEIFQTGQAWQVSGRYEIPLPRAGNFQSSIILGGDFKRTNTNADFGGDSVFASNVDVVQFMAGYDLSEADSCGSGDASIQGFFSPGFIGGQDDDASYEQARAGADPQYGYGLVSADRTTNLPAGFSWLSRFQGQYASGPLQGSEQLGIGGIDSVRGYFDREGNGDDGIIFSNQLQYPVNLPKVAGVTNQVMFLAFVDYGVAWLRDAQIGEQSQENFLGVGPGISYRLGSWISIDYDYGWRLARGDPDVHATGRNHLRVVVSFTY